MSNFNSLNNSSRLSLPATISISTWRGHLPFGIFLIDILQPRAIAELGTRYAVSYCVFCRAVKEMALNTRCFTINAGHGDAYPGISEPEVLFDLKEQHEHFYAEVSGINQSTFDAVWDYSPARTFDLVHLSGFRPDEAVKQDFEKWLPRMTDRGVVLFHDINVGEGNSGGRLWRELKLRYPHFEFVHSGGLGVLAVGQNYPQELRKLFDCSAQEAIATRQFFFQLSVELKDTQEFRQFRKLNKEAATAQGGNHTVEEQSREKKALLSAPENNLTLTTRGQHSLEKDLKFLKLNRQFQESLLKLEEKDRHIHLLRQTLEEFGQSGSYKLGRALSWPFRTIRRLTAAVNECSLVKRPPAQTQPRPETVPAPLQPQPVSGGNSQEDAAYNYPIWVQLYDTLTDSDRKAIASRLEKLEYQPLISIILPIYDADAARLRLAVQSVCKQLYPRWEVCVVADDSCQPDVRQVLAEYANNARIKVSYREHKGVHSAGSNLGLEFVTGEFIARLQSDDELAEQALYRIVEELNSHPEADLIYSDEDKIDERGQRREPHFKSDWNPDLFYSCNLVAHLGVYRTSIIKQLGGFSEDEQGCEDYDLALRFIEHIPEHHIRHVPQVLYHRRSIDGLATLASAETNSACETARNLIRSHLERIGIEAIVTEGQHCSHRVRYPVPASAPLVSLIVATRNRYELLSQTIKGLLDETAYAPMEIIIVDNQSTDSATLRYLREIKEDARVKVLTYDAPFNYSAINNLAVSEAAGELLGLINNDIQVISPAWLREMVSHALRPDIGGVGAKLLYPDDTVQHAGIVLGVNGIAGHLHRHIPRHSAGYHNRALITQNLSAVTGACLVLRREVFEEVGGFDEVNLPVAYNDVDLCLRIREQGYRIVWTPYAELYHLESASRGRDDTPENTSRANKEREYMLRTWSYVLKNDPYYNPNLTTLREDASLAVPPRTINRW